MQTTLKNQSTAKIIYLDYWRIFACIGVFTCHLWVGIFLPKLATSVPSLQSIKTLTPQCLGIQGDALYACGITPFIIWPTFNLESVFFNLSNIVFGLGYQAVHLFFFLSGFGLTLSALKNLKKMENNPSINWIDFLKKRFVRLYPYYWVVLTIYMFLNIFNYSSFLGFLKVYFLGMVFLNVIPATWFIPIILQLYLLFPFLFYLLNKTSSSLFLWLTLLIKVISSLAIIIVSILVWGKIVGFGHGGLAPGGIALTRLFEFCFGMGVAKRFFNAQNSLKILFNFKGVHNIIFGLILEGLGLFLSSKYASISWGNHTFPIGLAISDALIGVGIVILFINITFALEPFLSKINDKLIDSLSNATYQAYIFHGLCLNYVSILVALPIFQLTTIDNLTNSTFYILFVYGFMLLVFSSWNLGWGWYLSQWKFWFLK
ncbi:acyltransferase family protein [Gloeothece verrucosa]|uniref:Acyltransferase 3 n=1 Tax=Gloeothece verrucosa (strain PCC 7822) TaxID=497965 RepID=E0UCX6_GLOV7|nr:acyltransferase family protein [Gloeothece verrucosa]ADN16441.1 acyltransferase 3 [Gloeothece verrucosa PCC 7822]